MPELRSILQKYWGFDSFRPLQHDIIRTVMLGEDCLALLPTGGGKSVCFQVPALAREGMCLVISPLIALMKDQVESLRKKGITAFSIHSGMSRKEVIHTLTVAGESNCKFLYVSPERLETTLFTEYLHSLQVTLIAVDEAHCISQWGYDFRPSFLKIAALREELPEVPVLALTASATPAVQKDICERLHFRKQNIFQQSFLRPNLSYSVFPLHEKISKIISIFEKVAGTGIVYCRSRRRTAEISDLLKLHGFSSDCYHAGLTQDLRNERQDNWLKNDTRIIVCTNAFGMGIDKPDVRLVIHADMPDCLENYYQEAGRAGRDGKRAYAVLLYNEREITELHDQIEERFPPLSVIRQMHAHLMNHLQVPAGTGEGLSFEFDVRQFIRTFRLESRQVFAVLKVLEQENIISVNEQVYVPSRLQVIAGRERLFEFERQFPLLDSLIKALLRNYAGIIDQPVAVNEKVIASLVKSNVETITMHLNNLHAARVIDYFPQKNKPQIFLPINRIRSEDLQIDITRYNERKRVFAGRVQQMVEYARSREVCRSKMIGLYFGDKSIDDCGICDVCLSRKKKTVSRTDFKKIHSAIVELLNKGSLTATQIAETINNIPRQNIREVLQFLEAERLVATDDDGRYFLLK